MEVPNGIRICPCMSNCAARSHSLHVFPFHHLLKPCRVWWHNCVVFSTGCTADGPQLTCQEAAAVWSQHGSGDLAEGSLHFAGVAALGYVFAALLSASAELCVSLCPSCATGLMFLVSRSRGAINNLKPNGSDGNAPFGFAGLRLQADFRLHAFLIDVFDKCLRLCYWRGGLGITRLGFIQKSKTDFESDISPFLSSTGPVLKTSWMLFPCCSAEELPKLRPYSVYLKFSKQEVMTDVLWIAQLPKAECMQKQNCCFYKETKPKEN